MSEVLVLNATYEPLNVTHLARAIRLVLAGKAEVLHQRGEINSPSVAFPLPSVIRMLYYIARRRQKVALSKRNILMRDDYRCAYCGVEGDDRSMTIDHVLPRSRGGKGASWSGLVSCCQPCNQRKKNRTPEEANMKLRFKPYEPKYIPFLVFRRHHPSQADWVKYLTFYSVSIEERIE